MAFSNTSSDAELIKRRSQEFSDASALGDGTAIARVVQPTIRAARRGVAALEASTGTAASFAMLPEAKDVFFTPGQIRLRRIFVRDPQGRVTGLVSRKDGHDVTLIKSRGVM